MFQMPIHVIDDEMFITTFVSEVAKEFSAHVSSFYSGEQYLLNFNSDNYVEPRLIITDIRMSKMTGFELIDILRESGVQSKIIAMSGYHPYEKVHDKYCDAFLTKPFRIEDLQLLLSQLLL